MDATRRTEVDGVPVFWTPWDEEPHHAEILFRVGTADETLPLRGVTHLIEHLALFDFGQPAYSYNGTVQPKFTSFSAVGKADEVRAFVGAVTRALAALPYDRLDVEKRILDVEEAGHGVNERGWLKQLRYGAGPYGNVVKRELARPLLDDATIERWRAAWFTRGNAVITMTGEPPDTLGIDLPDGDRRPAPDAKPLGGLRLPSVKVRSDSDVSIGLVSAQSDALRTAVYVADRRLEACLRRERGVTYTVDHAVELVGRDRQHVAIWLDCLDEHAEFAATRLVAILRELADGGPTDEELEIEREGVRRTLEYHDAPLDEIGDAARDELLGVPLRTHGAWLQAIEALAPSECAEALRRALPEAILQVPPSAGDVMPDGFRAYDVDRPDLPRPEGRAFREKEETDCPVRPCEYTLGDEYLHLQPGDGSDPISARYGEVAGALGRAGGVYRILTYDERRFEVSHFKFHDGQELVAALRERIPSHLWLPPTGAMRAVDDLAAEQLAQPELVTVELQDLVDALRGDERPLALATDSQSDDDAKPGLVAVTGERLFFIWAEPSGDASRDMWNETERGEISDAAVETDDDGRPMLVFLIDGERFDIGGIDSPEAAARLADALGTPAPGVSSAR